MNNCEISGGYVLRYLFCKLVTVGGFFFSWFFFFFLGGLVMGSFITSNLECFEHSLNG